MAPRKTQKTYTANIPGLKISGDAVSVAQALRLYGLDPRDFGVPDLYYSESKNEYIPYNELSDEHLKNAILKRFVEAIDELRDLDLEDFAGKVYHYYDTTYSADVEIESSSVYALLIEELERRTD